MQSKLYTAQRVRRDYCTLDGANRLIERIKQHWMDKGLPAPNIKPIAVPACSHEISELERARYDIRSDMVSGLPKREARA